MTTSNMKDRSSGGGRRSAGYGAVQQHQQQQQGSTKKGMQVERKITMVNGISIIVGSVIGSGIFITPKGVYMAAGSLGAGIIVWFASGLFSMLGALCFMELGTSIGRSGGEYAYLLEAFGPAVAFMHLWVTLVVRQPTSLAIVALAFAQYVFTPFFPDCEPPVDAVRLLAAFSLCFITYLNCTSVRWVMRVQSVFTAAKLLALVAIVVAGFVYILQGNTQNFNNAFEGGTRADMLALSFYSGLFSYFGWHFLNLVTEEMVDPAKNLPRACTAAMVIVTAVYVLVNIAYVAVIPQEDLLSSLAVAVTFGNRMFGPLAWTVPVAVVISTIGSMNGIMFTSGRVLLVGAQDDQLPSVLGMLDVKKCTPTPAIIITGVMGILMLYVSDIYSLITYMSFCLWLTFGACVAGLLWLRYTRPFIPRPLTIPLVFPILFLIGCIALLILPLIADPYNTTIGAAIMLTGLPVYWLTKMERNQDLKEISGTVTKWMQIFFLVVPSSRHNE